VSALPPGAVIGILGTGQLGRMTALAAFPLGYEVHVLGPEPGPATQVTGRATLAAYDDLAALEAFAAAVDVVTYEFENVPAATAEFLATRVPVRPGPRALSVCQHRIREKAFLNGVGVATTAWRAVGAVDDVAAAGTALGFPFVLKTAELGYDGKGQTLVRADTPPEAAWAAIGGRPGLEAIAEAFVDFAYEASVVVARGLDGTVAAYDLVQNEHRHHILHRTVVPAPASPATREAASEIARTVVAALDYVGVLGIELFVTRDGRLLANELAPRPHNSAHWTQDGAVTSQFEQHARAVAGLPLGAPERRGDGWMVNLIGDDVHDLGRFLADPHAKIHLYGKARSRPGRKMGHVNRFRKNPD
jgi:5-(carboxyamino)imidazole ribonucleotide synthase